MPLHLTARDAWGNSWGVCRCICYRPLLITLGVEACWCSIYVVCDILTPGSIYVSTRSAPIALHSSTQSCPPPGEQGVLSMKKDWYVAAPLCAPTRPKSHEDFDLLRRGKWHSLDRAVGRNITSMIRNVADVFARTRGGLPRGSKINDH